MTGNPFFSPLGQPLTSFSSYALSGGSLIVCPSEFGFRIPSAPRVDSLVLGRIPLLNLFVPFCLVFFEVFRNASLSLRHGREAIWNIRFFCCPFEERLLVFSLLRGLPGLGPGFPPARPQW